ncbi:hypothetical protein AERO9A_300021 [Aeromonas salmonicida]|nr:hypothetical protein AERO9A_300021 [Aeromonas salmonicida]
MEDKFHRACPLPPACGVDVTGAALYGPENFS